MSHYLLVTGLGDLANDGSRDATGRALVAQRLLHPLRLDTDHKGVVVSPGVVWSTASDTERGVQVSVSRVGCIVSDTEHVLFGIHLPMSDTDHARVGV